MHLRRFLEWRFKEIVSIGKLFLNQQSYIEKVLHRFNAKNCKPVNSPLAAHFKYLLTFHQRQVKILITSHVPCSSIVGSILNALVCIKPNLSHTISFVNCYMTNPRKEYLEAVKYSMYYLNVTANVGLVFDMNLVKHNNVVGYVDFDYGGDLERS